MTKVLKTPAKIDRVPSKEPNKKEHKKKRFRLMNDHNGSTAFVFSDDISLCMVGGSDAAKKFKPLF
jgi:hypothetical protein